ncbi:hypothetical protein HaLaN_23155 [Haematococcus lacustris]|uniref:Uncharacterized protein n=1 Tax=Haematococcus lacustris TaxID=44745 RepID=A0A6A0A170_HAELA|nr:hypothetical protein HaLaN_23155 [Haematococcus lacustris]
MGQGSIQCLGAGLLRLRGLRPSPFELTNVWELLAYLMGEEREPSWELAQIRSRVRPVMMEEITVSEPLTGRVVFTGHPALPQTLMMDLAAAPSLLALDGPDTQLTLSNLVLANAAPLLSSLLRAIREVAQGGSTRVNLRPDTLDLLRAQLAGQQVLPAAWPPGGLTFPSFSWFGLRGLDVTLGPYTPTNSWGQPWVQANDSIMQLGMLASLTTVELCVQVAVKRLVFSGLAGDLHITGQRQQVLREAELNTRLAHPHLVATYAYYLTTLDSSSSSQASPMLPGWPSQALPWAMRQCC